MIKNQSHYEHVRISVAGLRKILHDMSINPDKFEVPPDVLASSKESLKININKLNRVGRLWKASVRVEEIPPDNIGNQMIALGAFMVIFSFFWGYKPYEHILLYAGYSATYGL